MLFRSCFRIGKVKPSFNTRFIDGQFMDCIVGVCDKVEGYVVLVPQVRRADVLTAQGVISQSFYAAYRVDNGEFVGTYCHTGVPDSIGLECRVPVLLSEAQGLLASVNEICSMKDDKFARPMNVDDFCKFVASEICRVAMLNILPVDNGYIIEISHEVVPIEFVGLKKKEESIDNVTELFSGGSEE